MSFVASRALRKEFSMVDVQNATLAGGVAVGSSCDMMIGPWYASGLPTACAEGWITADGT
jgi:ammonium transporter Rh